MIWTFSLRLSLRREEHPGGCFESRYSITHNLTDLLESISFLYEYDSNWTRYGNNNLTYREIRYKTYGRCFEILTGLKDEDLYKVDLVFYRTLNVVKLRSRSRSRSIPGPFQIYFKSFQSISIQNLDQKLMLFLLWHPPTQQTFLKLTPCPPRLQLQTLRMGVILTGKLTFWGVKCLAKVDHAIKIAS